MGIARVEEGAFTPAVTGHLPLLRYRTCTTPWRDSIVSPTGMDIAGLNSAVSHPDWRTRHPSAISREIPPRRVRLYTLLIVLGR